MERIKLLKKNFMAFAEGTYIESNIGYEKGKSIYTAPVVPMDQREKQWLEIKKVEADGRLCNVYKDKKSMIEYKSRVRD
jgi:hypothetical protein